MGQRKRNGEGAALYEAPLPRDRKLSQLSGRLTDEQRRVMLATFDALQPEQVYRWAWVYFSRELRFVARHRDWQGIEDLVRAASRRGVVDQMERAIHRVEWEIWADIAPPPESRVVPEWERSTRQRRGLRRWEASEPDHYPHHFWRPSRFNRH